MRRRTAFFFLTLGLGAAVGAFACTEPVHNFTGSDAGDDAGDAATDASTDGPLGDTDGEAPAIALDPACDALATAQCERLDTCSGGFAIRARFVNAAACKAAVGTECVRAGKATDAAKPKPPPPKPAKDDAGNDIDAGPPPVPEIDGRPTAACASAIAAQTCPDFLVAAVPAACLQKGPRAAGEACGTGGQCASGFCDVAPNHACGTCKTVPTSGSPCAKHADCGGAFYCTDTKRCAPLAVEGDNCDSMILCAAGLSCVMQPDDAGVNKYGTCTKAGGATETCDSTGATGPGCDPAFGLFCTSAGKCAVEDLRTAGQPCGNVNGAQKGCESGGLCATSPGGRELCVAAVPLNSLCDATKGPPCAAPAKCLDVPNGTSMCLDVDPADCN